MNGQPKRQQTRLGDTKPIRHIHELPNEVLPHIMQNLTVPDIVSLRESNRELGNNLPSGQTMSDVFDGLSASERRLFTYNQHPARDILEIIPSGWSNHYHSSNLSMVNKRIGPKRDADKHTFFKKPLNRQPKHVQRELSNLGYMP